MSQVELDIIRLFSQKPDVELTIHQISKNLKKSYAFTNKYAHDMIHQEILKKKVVGNSILCSLNKDNEKLIGLLVMNSIIRKMQFEHSLKDQYKIELSVFLRGLTDVKTIFLSDSTINIVALKGSLKHDDLVRNSNNKIAGLKINIIDYDSFIKGKDMPELSQVIVLKNHELFWSIIFKAI